MKENVTIAMISTAAALAGVLISQAISLLLSFFDKRHQKQKLLRQKYEEMMFHFQDSLSYPNQVASCRTLDQLLLQTHSVPAQRAMGLALLYFPTLAPFLRVYIQTCIAYYLLITSVYDPEIPASAGAQARVHSSEFILVENNLFKAKDDTLKAIDSNAKKYTKA
ncbi:MAG: hypothetical protein KAX15_02735 [Candidatus Omnitrophica bacterium]|nr:hypothetical protein [Candidatus Omnitrophota bacterium]